MKKKEEFEAYDGRFYRKLPGIDFRTCSLCIVVDDPTLEELCHRCGSTFYFQPAEISGDGTVI